ncbi:GNAT family N-acetyltransferase [Streptomyces sp. NPDC003077]|uniref:GNAT family N-acetyltransferase n=1 Tax=Streptomyces sp. NPDC003077 TaxID=3154443 RepID=UPI0033A11233
MDITIRPVRPEEYAEVGELLVTVYTDEGLLTSGDRDPYADVLRRVAHRVEHAEVLVAVEAGGERVLGAVTFAAPGTPYAEIAGPEEGEFRMLAVDPAARGRGVGEALVVACLDRARALGLRGMVLSSQQHLLPAHRLYRRLGFERAPERDWDPIPEIRLWAFARKPA